MRLAYKLSVLVMAVAIISTGCSDRGDTITPITYDNSSLVWTIGHEYHQELGFTMFPEIKIDPKMYGKVYTPPGYDNPGQGRPYPVLILLSPFNETDEFYFNHGLKDVADRLISEGRIEPMIIICMNGRNSYGGTFYADASASGKYTTILGDIEGEISTGTLIDYIDGVFNTLSDARHGDGMGRKNRAISGVGVGGYGAMRLAVMHSENYSSVSAISAPLDFDGSGGTGGFVPLFQNIINELDTTALGLDSTYKIMDTSFNSPVRNLIFAGATSFSPHDTSYVNPEFLPYNPPYIVEPNGIWQSSDTLQITDQETYLKPYGEDRPFKFHMPFDKTGAAYDPIWQLWLDNNIPNLMANYPGALDTTAIMLLTSADAPDELFGFDQQTLDFADYLTSQGIAYNDTSFAGYPGFPADGNAILFDILGRILEFHSRNFETPEF